MIVIELDRAWKRRNQHEGRWVSRASCLGMEEFGDGMNITKLARRLLGILPPNEPVSVVRAGVECFTRAPLLKWAEMQAAGAIGKTQEQPAHLRKREAAE